MSIRHAWCIGAAAEMGAADGAEQSAPRNEIAN